MLKKIFLSLTLLNACIALYFLADFAYFVYTPVLAKQSPFTYNLKPGSSLNKLAFDLSQEKILAHPNYFIFLGRLTGHTQGLQSGEYQFVKGLTPLEILQQVTAGKVVQHSLTLIEGWTLQDVIQAVQQDPVLHHTLTADKLHALLKALSQGKANLEGFFYPDTYHFPATTTDAEFLQRAHQVMVIKLQKCWQKRAKNLPLKNAYEALIVASLIEKETALKAEKPLVASVIMNRLRKKMLLQIDPTVIYALGKNYQGRLTKRDLNTSSPYNTYRHKGLPPTPIALPSLSSLRAAMVPATTNYYYFVAKGDGSHQFSRTLAEQNRAVHQFVLRPTKRLARKQ